MMQKIALLIIAITLSGCGGGGDAGGQTTASTTPGTLGPGQSIVLKTGSSVLVPATTTVHDPASNNTIVVSGDHNTVHTPAGSQVTVPASAAGAADNTVTTN